MKALTISRFGGAENLVYADVPRPVVKRGQVLVRVHAASVNPRDWLLQEGRYQFRHLLGRFPITLGSDFSGTVTEVGSGVDHFGPGDEVFGLSWRMGAFAEYVAIDATALARKPGNVTHRSAAAIPCAGQTAWRAINPLTADDRVLINGAAGGVGSFAVQFARAKGCLVTAVASGRNKSFCRELGADEFIDYEKKDFTSSVTGQTMVFDAVGRSRFARCRRVLTENGVYVTTVPTGAAIKAWMSTRASSAFRAQARQSVQLVFARTTSNQLTQIVELVSKGHARSAITEEFAFLDIPAAFALSKTWRSRGKITVAVGDGGDATE